jgi:multiple sugar transport system ATP-binding protein
VEPLGAETLLVLTLEGGSGDLVARVGRETRLRAGEHATLLLDTAAIHLFDATTTRIIPRDLP